MSVASFHLWLRRINQNSLINQIKGKKKTQKNSSNLETSLIKRIQVFMRVQLNLEIILLQKVLMKSHFNFQTDLLLQMIVLIKDLQLYMQVKQVKLPKNQKGKAAYR